MPGMGGSPGTGNPTVVAAFHSALLRQLLLIGLVVVVAAVAWNLLRTVQYRRAVAAGAAPLALVDGRPSVPEPAGRRLLRIGFGVLWIFDGLLQLQSGMVLGMPATVLRPGASSSPDWVRHLVGVGANIWSDHPVQAAAATVWIQVGIGVLLIVAPRGRWSRVAGLVSLGWALVVWVFGEALGGIFAPGLTWAFGAPGAVLFYGLAGGLVAMPERAWAGRRAGRFLTLGMGVFFIGMAVLQAWPGRGFWQGGSRGTLVGMVISMARTSQPGFLAGWLSSFASFDAAHGWGVNLFLVIALAAIGVALCTGRSRVIVPATAATAVLCLAAWVLVEDLGVFGGVGTDPNSMLPMLAVVAAGTVALVRPATAAQPAVAPLPVAAGDGAAWWERLAPGYAARVLAAGACLVVILVGAVPMTAAATNPNADPIVSEAVDGTPNLVDTPAPGFTLTDQRGAAVPLSSLRGKAVAMTFLDPVCTSDCPLIAQDFLRADQQLGQSGRTVFVAVVANPIYRSVAATQAFDREEGLSHVGNWLFLTGSVAELTKVWNAYGVQVQISPAGAMVDHPDVADLIGPRGRLREVLDADPGTGSAAGSSFSSLLAQQMRTVLGA